MSPIKMYKTPLGIWYATTPEKCKQHNELSTVKAYDTCYAVENYMREVTNNKEAPLNLSKIRKQLMIVLSGQVTSDEDYIEALTYCYQQSPLFKYYIRKIVLDYNGHLNIILRAIIPLISNIDTYSLLLPTQTGGIVKGYDNGYIYITNPQKECVNPYVTTW